MEKTILVGGKEVKFRATAAVPRLYRIRFGRDIMQDMLDLSKSLKKAKDGAMQFSRMDLETFESCAYIMAKHADASVPSTIEDWLDGFEMFDIYQVLPEILGLWGLNEQTTVESKKKLEQVAGR